MNHSHIIATELNIGEKSVNAAIQLIDEGNTIPFIARYRKELTGGIDDEQLRHIADRITYLRQLDQRKDEVIQSIEQQGQLTDELAKMIQEAQTLQRIDDLYRPYRPKRATRASKAIERGLTPLADLMLTKLFVSLAAYHQEIQSEASRYVDAEKELPDVDAVLQGAMDIIAEKLSDHAEVRESLRAVGRAYGTLTAQTKDLEEDDGTYETYADFKQRFDALRPHQILALNRGEKEGVLKVSLDIPEERAIAVLEKVLFQGKLSKGDTVPSPGVKNPHLVATVVDAWKRLLQSSTETALRNELTEAAEEQAIKVFAANVRSLLMLPPLKGHTVLGVDPGFRTGCKLAVVDPTGRLLETSVIYPVPPQSDVAGSEKTIDKLVKQYGVTVIAIGNGTASRETEQFVAAMLQKGHHPGVSYMIVDEAGASVYSASAVARKEFPDLDVSERSAVSIARRVQDPLAELVKIDPQSIGVGQYQHDANQKQLTQTLRGVVENAVNTVGVDVNTASPELLTFVAGLNGTSADNIVRYREENGPFKNRQSLKKVPRLGPKTFEQCAGFLRISEGDNPLDQTSIHPESYDTALSLVSKLGGQTDDIQASGTTGRLKERLDALTTDDIKKTAQQLSAGVPTLTDIIEALKRPGRDPREDAPAPILRDDVLTIDDLNEGMTLRGTVRNVVDFGAFVDIGVGQDGLVHISEMADRYVSHPLDIVRVGDVVDVTVKSVDVKRKRIGLSMKPV